MSCGDVQGLLSAYQDLELDVAKSLELEAHLGTCAPCASMLDGLRRLQSDIRGAGLAFTAPVSLELRVRDAVGRETRGRRFSGAMRARRWSFAASLAVVAAASWIGGAHWTERSSRALPAELIASHVRSLMADHLVDVASSDQHTVKPWFSGKLDFAPPVADYANAGFPLVGGRLEYVGGRPAAALVYRRGPHVVNVYASPAADDRTSAVRLESHQGYNLATWTRAGLAYWAVSDVNAEDLEALARLFHGAP